MSNPKEVKLVLRNKSRISRSRFPNIIIQHYLAIEQRQYMKRLHAELHKRKANGEENIAIRYVYSVPAIITISESDKKHYREEDESPEKKKGITIHHPAHTMTGPAPDSD